MGSPQQLRVSTCLMTEADSLRIHRLIVKLGSIRAAMAALGCSISTFAASRDQGRMLRKTRDRLLEALARAEA